MLTHGLRGPPELRAALAAWRRERLVLGLDPWLLVLSSGRGLDPAHPAFHAALRPLLFVPSAAAAGLRERFAETDVRVASVPELSARLALDHLRRLGAKRITLEAGPHDDARALRRAAARGRALARDLRRRAAAARGERRRRSLDDARLAAVLPEIGAERARRAERTVALREALAPGLTEPRRLVTLPPSCVSKRSSRSPSSRSAPSSARHGAHSGARLTCRRSRLRGASSARRCSIARSR